LYVYDSYLLAAAALLLLLIPIMACIAPFHSFISSWEWMGHASVYNLANTGDLPADLALMRASMSPDNR
jgi:hypothetical protein